MNVLQTYRDFMVPENLQEHMLRVAALAEILAEHWTGEPIDTKSLVQACIFHDIAKPMNFDLEKQARFGMTPADIQKLDTMQKRLKHAYGTNEHEATVRILQEIGCTPTAVRIVDNLEWKFIPRLLDADDTTSLLPIYCDMRIGPKGILSLGERLDDLKNRTDAKDYDDNVRNGNTLESVLTKRVQIDVNSIGDSQLHERFDALLATEL